MWLQGSRPVVARRAQRGGWTGVPKSTEVASARLGLTDPVKLGRGRAGERQSLQAPCTPTPQQLEQKETTSSCSCKVDQEPQGMAAKPRHHGISSPGAGLPWLGAVATGQGRYWMWGVPGTGGCGAASLATPTRCQQHLPV